MLTPRTKAVIAVHLFGNVAPIAEIEALGVPVIEDAAQAAGTILADGRRPGALGSTLATFSFFPSKNLGAFGDGGAVTTNDAALAETIATLRFHGSQRQADVRRWSATTPASTRSRPASCASSSRTWTRWADGRRAAARAYAEAGLGELVSLPVADRGRRARLAPLRRQVRARRRADRRAQGRATSARPPTTASRPTSSPRCATTRPRSSLPGTEEASRTNLAIPMSPVLDRAQADEVVAAWARSLPPFR